MRAPLACRPLRWGMILVALALYLVPSTAFARPATVTLTSGETAEVDVVEMELGKQVKVRLSDGSEKTLPWEWITSIEMHAVAEEAPPSVEAAVVTPPLVEAASPKPQTSSEPVSLTKEQELLLLDAEIERVDEEMPSIGGPITLTAVGFGAGGLLVFMGAGLRTTCDDVADESSCRTASTAFLVTGGLGIAAGAGGVAWLVSRINARKPYRQKIHELEEKRNALRVGVDAGPTGTLGTLSWSF